MRLISNTMLSHAPKPCPKDTYLLIASRDCTSETSEVTKSEFSVSLSLSLGKQSEIFICNNAGKRGKILPIRSNGIELPKADIITRTNKWW